MSNFHETLISKLSVGATEKNYTNVVLYPKIEYVNTKLSYTEFIKAYCANVYDNNDENLFIGENPGSTPPVIIDMRLVFDPDAESLFDDELICSIIFQIQSSIESLLRVNENNLICCYLKSEPYIKREQSQAIINFRFQFPYCKVDAEYQKKYLFPNIIKRLENADVKEHFHQDIDIRWENVISTSIYSRPISMYGSKSYKESNQLHLASTFGKISEMDIEKHDLFNMQKDLDDIFAPQDHSFVKAGLLENIFENTTEDSEEDDDELERWTPLFLSVDFSNEVVLPLKGTKIKSANIEANTDNRPIFANDDLSTITHAERFINMWKNETVLDFTGFKCIGEALYTITEGDESGLLKWMQIVNAALDDSEHDYPDYFIFDSVRDTCEKYYYSFKIGRIGINTLATIARVDDRKNYTEWHKNWCLEAMHEAVSGEHNDVARCFYRIYWLEFFFTYEGKKSVWYEFKRHMLAKSPNGSALRKLLSGDFMEKFIQFSTELSSMRTNPNLSEEEKTRISDKCIAVNKFIRKLKNSPYKGTIVRECEEFFLRDDLDMWLDNDPEILGLPNGVFVSTEKSCTFRAGRPEDYITRQTKVPYRTDLHWKHRTVVNLMKWAVQTHPDKECREHFWKFSASILRGGNNDKKFPNWAGGGDNGKSMWIKLFEEVYGPYCVKIPVNLFTGSRGNGENATPALARTAYTRIVFADEPDKNVMMKNAIFKNLTGSDTFFARFLKKNGVDVKPTFKLVMVSNDPPTIDADKAFKRRYYILPFRTMWSDDAPEDEDEQMKLGIFKLDPFFEKQIPDMAAAHLWISKQYYPKYLKEGLRKEPALAVEYTKKYWEEHDIYNQFTADNIVVCKTEEGEADTESVLDIMEIYGNFKGWYSFCFGRKNIPDKSVFKSEIITRWGEPVDNCWSGIKFKERKKAKGKDE